MKATYYDYNTRLAMFSVKIGERCEGNFTEYLASAGYEYIKHRQSWVNKKLGVECIIWED